MTLTTKPMGPGYKDSDVDELYYMLLLSSYVERLACHRPSKRTPGSKLPDWVLTAWKRFLVTAVCPLLRNIESPILLRVQRQIHDSESKVILKSQTLKVTNFRNTLINLFHLYFPSQ